MKGDPSIIASDVEPEFLRIPDAVKFSGLSRTTLYELMKDGRLKSKCIRGRGNVNGIRIIPKQALRDLINEAED